MSRVEAELRAALKALRHAPEHSFAASTFRTGQWRHLGCARCLIEEKADQLLKEKRAARS